MTKIVPFSNVLLACAGVHFFLFLHKKKQGFSIMFSTSAAPTGNGQEGEGGDDGKSDPWGMGGSSGSPSNRQSPSSLSWLTNLRKGIMSGGMTSAVCILLYERYRRVGFHRRHSTGIGVGMAKIPLCSYGGWLATHSQRGVGLLCASTRLHVRYIFTASFIPKRFPCHILNGDAALPKSMILDISR